MSDAHQQGSPNGTPWGGGAPAGWPAPDPWGHEHGEDEGHRLDATGHMHHQTDPRAVMIGEPHVITTGERVMRALFGVLAVVVLVGALVAGILAIR